MPRLKILWRKGKLKKKKFPLGFGEPKANIGDRKKKRTIESCCDQKETE